MPALYLFQLSRYIILTKNAGLQTQTGSNPIIELSLPVFTLAQTTIRSCSAPLYLKAPILWKCGRDSAVHCLLYSLREILSFTSSARRGLAYFPSSSLRGTVTHARLDDQSANIIYLSNRIYKRKTFETLVTRVSITNICYYSFANH
jgi:hypothetical protein